MVKLLMQMQMIRAEWMKSSLPEKNAVIQIFDDYIGQVKDEIKNKQNDFEDLEELSEEMI